MIGFLLLLWSFCSVNAQIEFNTAQHPHHLRHHPHHINHHHYHIINHKHNMTDPFPNQKIAFMFLARDSLPFELLWEEFFTFRASPEQYNIYVHLKPGQFFPPTSFFHGKETEERILVKWGGVTEIKAFQLLIRAALKDPNNVWFSMMSETCIPLVPFPKWRRVMLSHDKSLMNCRFSEKEMELTRYNDALQSVGIGREHFRKSSTWYAVIRKHAQLFADQNDTFFEAWSHIPIADEHIMSSLIASKGLEEKETTCTDGFAFVYWRSNIDSHPSMFQALDINHEFLTNRLQQPAGTDPGFNQLCAFPELCHFTARKFMPESRYTLQKHAASLLSEPGYPYTLDPFRSITRYLRYDDTRSKLYLIESTTYCEISDNFTLHHLHIDTNTLNFSAIPTFSVMEKERLRPGLPFYNFRNGTLLKTRGDNTVWVVYDNTRYMLPDFDTLLSLKDTIPGIVDVRPFVITRLFHGPTWPSVKQTVQL